MSVAETLLRWHGQHGRHTLPWQSDRTPYRVWVSEIMLQQTQVATVIAYYQRFMQRFPDVKSLAEAPVDEVLHLWSGLGYYSRARNLQRAAQLVVEQHGGEFPLEVEQLAELPGIGRSTAAAIVALSSGRRATILDGNVKRVLSRVFGIDGPAGVRATDEILWRLAEDCTPHEHVDTYTQAIMDFGATLCTRAKPLCMHCPMQNECLAFKTDRVAELPTPKARRARRTRQVVMLLARRSQDEVLLLRRPPQGIWGGLWSLPEFEDLDAARQYCEQQLRAATLDAAPLPTVRHAFTHFDLEITPVQVHCQGAAAGIMDGGEMLWYNARSPERIGLPAPIAALIAALPSH